LSTSQQAPLGGADEPSLPLADGVTDYALFLTDRDGRIASWNEGARRILGYEEGDVLGQPAALIFTPEDRAAGVPERELAAAAREGRVAGGRWCQRKDGTRFWADGVLERLTGGAAGETVRFAKVLRDATRQREAEARLALREERYRALFGSIDQGFCIVEVLLDAQGKPRDYRFVEVNPAFERHTGLTNALGRTARELVPSLDEFWFRTYGSVALTGQAVRFESHAPAMGRWFDVHALPVGPPEERRVAILFTDITEQRRTLEALRIKNDEVVAVLESITDAFYAVDDQWRFTYVNAEAERLLLRRHGELLGKNIWEEFPAAVGSAFEAHYRRAARERVTAVFQAYYPPPLDGWYDLRAYPSAAGGLAVYFRNISAERLREQERERLLAEQQRLLAEQARLVEELREARSRLEAALLAGDIGTWTWDIARDAVTGDAIIARLFSHDPDDLAAGRVPVQRFFDTMHEEDRARAGKAVADALAGREDYRAEYRVVLPDGSRRWLFSRGKVTRDAAGTPVSMIGAAVDITERVERERRERFLADLTARVRALLDPEEVLYEAAKAVGEHMGAHRCLYIEIDEAAAMLTVRRDFVQEAEGVASIAGTYPLDSFGPPIIESLRAGNVTRSDDTQRDPRLGPEHRATFGALDFRAFLGVPLHRAGRWVAILAVHYKRPRAWTREEGQLLTEVAERTWLAVENARLFRETRRRAEREALLNRIGAALRATDDPEEAQARAAALLGEALGLDLCHAAVFDPARDAWRVARDWHRGDLPSLSGEYPMAAWRALSDEALGRGATSVLPDVAASPALSEETKALFARLGITAFLSVPFLDASGSPVAALSAGMADGPREWTPEEVALIEAAASLVRSAAESARAQKREHNIAQQLQAALQPPLPDVVSGLELAQHCRVALDEAEVGGDFFDVFFLEKGCTALVVGDLSGKGLAAAAQVATVRNMLRFALYNGRTLDKALTALNRTLVENNLIQGFATLFVGCYDSGAKTLTYVNCGQEPALVRRAATGQVEELASTGPVLGSFTEGRFEERVVSLSPGDALAVFTDGLTEAGPSRAELLEASGVAALLAAQLYAGGKSASALAERLVAEVDAYAQGGIRDDVCLLVGIVKGS
jgi:PAS domain S-box-containing protein